MSFFKRRLPLLIVLAVGLGMIAQYYVPAKGSQKVGEKAADFYIIIQGVVIFLGIFSLIQVHAKKIYKQEAGWGYSGFVFLGMGLMVGAGVASGGELRPGYVYSWMYDNTMVPLSSTLFAMLAFFLASAAFRAFRARSLDATLLLAAALVIMFCRVPWGEALIGSIPNVGPEQGGKVARSITDWILSVPNTAATRGLFIGTALGIVATSLKIIFGVERGYLGDEG